MKESIFVWIPKAAGTSIFTALEKHGTRKLKHEHEFSIFNNQGSVTFSHVCVQTLLEKKYLNIDYFNRSFKFTFVRNPWERILSLWKFRNGLGYSDFKDFIYEEITRDFTSIGAYNVSGLSQANQMCDWLLDSDGKLIVDFVGRFEDLQRDFNTVCRNLGIPEKSLPHSNKSHHRRPNQIWKNLSHYTEYYDDETRDIVAKRYAKDIKYFGYKFGE